MWHCKLPQTRLDCITRLCYADADLHRFLWNVPHLVAIIIIDIGGIERDILEIYVIIHYICIVQHRLNNLKEISKAK